MSEDYLLLAREALKEDQADSDITSMALERALMGKKFPRGKLCTFSVVAKQDGVFSGALWVDALSVEAEFKLFKLVPSGSAFAKGEVLLQGTAEAPQVLAFERVLLNELQMLCGVASQTRKFVEIIERAGYKKECSVYHTRKTLALHRSLQIRAVLDGGGKRHRKDLQERVLLKENHKILASQLGVKFGTLVSKVVRENPDALIEVENIAEAKVAFTSGADFVLLDNFTPEQLDELLPSVPKTATLELSGGLTLENFQSYLRPQVARYSVGAITHSVKAIDLALDWEFG